jgi:peroxiredoxin
MFSIYFIFGLKKIGKQMKNFILLLLILVSVWARAEGYKIKLTIDSTPNQKIKLANYYLGNIYLKDSTVFDGVGHATFSGDSLLPQGLYKIYLDDKNHFDFLLGADQQFSMAKPSFSSSEINIEGATETEKFQEYAVFLKTMQTKGAALNKKLGAATTEEKTAIRNEINGLTTELHNYWFSVKQEYPNTFLSAFLLANYVPALDISTLPAEVQKNDSLLLLARFNFQKAHYWDYFDYTDERLLYTPLYKPKLETWFTKILYQNYDSVKTEVITFIENINPQKRIFQFATSWFLNASINSNVMGMDALFVDIARRYYLSGQAFWTTEESMKKIRENVMFAEHNLIGLKAPDLTLETFDGEFVNLHKINAKVTVILIYEPGCSHCKEFIPKFHDEVYAKYKSNGLQVFAIYTMDKKPEWEEFLQKHKLFDWINAWDERHISQFKVLYDARKTPGIYVLDENKKIIAKGMSVEQLAGLIDFELR